MLRRNNRELMEKANLIRRMNRTEALDRLNNIWRHGTTSIGELRIITDRIKDF